LLYNVTLGSFPKNSLSEGDRLNEKILNLEKKNCFVIIIKKKKKSNTIIKILKKPQPKE